MSRRKEKGQSLVEVILGMALFAMLMAPLTLYTARTIQDLFRARDVAERTDSYSRSAYLFTSGLAYAQMPLRQAYDNQLEYHVKLDDGDRYVMIWRDCRTTSGVVPGIYAAISSPRYNLVTNPSFETAWKEVGYPDDNNPASADPGPTSDGVQAKARTGTGTNATTRSPMDLGQATSGYNSTQDGTAYNQDFTIGAPQNWTRHYRDDENRGDAVAPTEWPTAERVTFAQAQAGAAVAPTSSAGTFRAGSRALRLTTWAALDARTRDSRTDGATEDGAPTDVGADGRTSNHYFLFPQPQRATYTYLQSQVYDASPGTKFLVGGYMADLTDPVDTSTTVQDPNNRPRIEWYWVTSKNGKQSVIPERSGAVTMPDTDDDTPDGGLNAPSNDFSTYRYKITRPAPEGTVGIQLRLTPGLITPTKTDTGAIKANDEALFDGIMLQPMSGPRIDTQRTNDYSADRSSKSPHTYFDGNLKVTGSDIWADAYNPVIKAPTGKSWVPYWLGTANLSASAVGSSSFANTYPPTAATDWTQSRIQNRAQLLFAFDQTKSGGNWTDPGCSGNLFTYYNASGAALTADTARRTQTKQVAVNVPVFKNPQTADSIKFPIGSLLSPENPPANAPGLS